MKKGIYKRKVTSKRKMKKWKKALLIIFSVILIGSTALAVWQWNNLKAIYYLMTVENSKGIADEIEKTKKEREEIVSEYIDGKVRDFTEEEEKKITSGEITVEEAVEIIKKDFNESVLDSDKTSLNQSRKPSVKKMDEFIADQIIKLYSYKAYYLGQLGQIEKKAVADYVALPKKERNLVSKQSIVDKYLGTVNGLLIECDKRVYGIMDIIRKELEKNHMDTSIVDKIGSSYEEEKALKKAYYMSLLKE